MIVCQESVIMCYYKKSWYGVCLIKVICRSYKSLVVVVSGVLLTTLTWTSCRLSHLTSLYTETATRVYKLYVHHAVSNIRLTHLLFLLHAQLTASSRNMISKPCITKIIIMSITWISHINYISIFMLSFIHCLYFIEVILCDIIFV
jgi:hypothetical protein